MMWKDVSCPLNWAFMIQGEQNHAFGASGCFWCSDKYFLRPHHPKHSEEIISLESIVKAEKIEGCEMSREETRGSK